MRFVIIAFIAGVAIFMAWLAFQPVCEGGVEAATEAECRKTGKFDVHFCREAFLRAEHVGRSTSGGYSTQQECMRTHPVCFEAEGFRGYVAKPKAYCLKPGPLGVALISPEY